MKLIRFELRKVFSGNIKYFALLLILLNAAVFYVGMIPRIPSAEQMEYERIWREKAGEQGGSIEEKRQYLEEQTADYGLLMTYLGAPDVMTEEEKKAVTERFRDTDYLEMEPEELYAESAALGQIMTEYTSAAEYGSFVDEMESRAEAMLGVPIFENSRFSAANIRKTVEDFADVKEIDVTPADGRYLEPMQNFYLTDILCIVMICLFCFRLFGFDHDSGMGNLIHTAPAGRTALRFAQLTAVWLTAALSAALLYGGNLLQTAVLTGAENLGAYVQGIAAFRNVAFPCTVGTYLLLYLAGKILAALLSASVCQFFCVKFGGGKTAWLFFAGVTAASFFLWFLVPDSPAVKLFRYLNPVGIFDMKQILGNYQNLNLFSVPVSLLSAAAFFTLVLGGLCSAAVLLVWSTELRIRFPGEEIRKRICRRKQRRLPAGIFLGEWRKLLADQKGWIIALAVLILPWSSFSLAEENLTPDDFYYGQFINAYGGDYTEEKAGRIKEMYENGDFAEEAERKAADRLYGQVLSMAETRGEKLGIVDLRRQETFFSDRQTETLRMLILCLALTLSLSPLFWQDTGKGMDRLFASTPAGRRIYPGKMSAAAGLGALYGAAVWCPVYAEYFIRYGIADGAYSIRSVPELAHAAFDLPIAAYMVLTVAMRVLIGAYLGIFIGFLAQILQQPAQNIFAGILLLILPLCLSYVGGMGYENPLVNLIKNELASATAHVQILSGFQRSCVGFGPAEWGIFLLIPAVMLCIGKKKWDQGGALKGFCPGKCPLK